MTPEILFQRLVTIAQGAQFASVDPGFSAWLQRHRTRLLEVLRRHLPTPTYTPATFTASPLWRDIERFLYLEGPGAPHRSYRGDLADPDFWLAKDLYQSPESMSPEDLADAIPRVVAYMARIREKSPPEPLITYPADMSTEERIAAWALASYRGEAGFLVHMPPMPGGFGIMEGLRTMALQRPFVRTIQGILSDIRDEGAVSIQTQDDGERIFARHAEAFLRAMFHAHEDGAIPFGASSLTPQAVYDWLTQEGIA